MMYWDVGSHFAGWLHLILFWGFLIIAILYLLKMLLGGDKKEKLEEKPAPQESAADILKRRYAAGEINKEEFEEKMKDISKIP